MTSLFVGQVSNKEIGHLSRVVIGHLSNLGLWVR
jgi:hypothetical protein